LKPQTATAHILIVEDEPELAELLRDYLVASSFTVEIINDGALAVNYIQKHKPSLILLDLMLPNKDGVDICKEVRQFSAVPIMMLTARIEEIDRLLGLELGADDYICKPYSPREVVARVKAVLRRTQASIPLTQHLIDLDEKTLKVCIKSADIELTLVEFQLFSMLYKEPGRIFSREQIMSSVYSDYRVVSDRTIDSHVKKLRKKIQTQLPDEEVIYSVYGAGYKFEPPA